MNDFAVRSVCFLTCWLTGLLMPIPPIQAQTGSRSQGTDPAAKQIEDGWIVERDDQTGLMIRTKELTLHPQPAPRPALKHRFLVDDFHSLPGNSAIYYLKAMGFLEQNPARERLAQLRKNATSQAQEQGKEINQMPPWVWLDTPPSELPVDEVKEYLQLTSFQRMFLREAARRQRFDMERNLRDVEDPLGYLLPEIQAMRELARTQSIRCRLAIAEGRLDDAIAITGQQFTLAHHLGQDDFLVSNLVGIAIASIAWNDALYLVQHPEAPNLYWALTTMPDPLVETRRAMAMERQMLYQQMKVLREVDETPRPAGYWRDFLDRLGPQILPLASALNLANDADAPELERSAMVGFVAAAYPGAKDYLIEQWDLPREQVEAYPIAQVVFLAMVRFYDDWRDEFFKWTYLPFWQARTSTASKEFPKEFGEASERYGWCAAPTGMLLPAILAVNAAEARSEQSLALIQTVEAIRAYAAAHDGKLPPSLNALSLPAPREPFTGQPLDYELLDDGRAILNGHKLPGLRYRLVLRIAQ